MTAAELLACKQAWNIQDDARMCLRPKGFPRGEWRRQNPVKAVIEYQLSPSVTVCFQPSCDCRQVMVIRRGRIIERINLDAAEADQRLARHFGGVSAAPKSCSEIAAARHASGAADVLERSDDQ